MHRKLNGKYSPKELGHSQEIRRYFQKILCILTQILPYVLLGMLLISLYWGLFHSRRKKEILKILTTFNRGQERIYNMTELSKYTLDFFMNHTGSRKGALFVYYRQANELRLSGSVGLDKPESFPPLLTGPGVQTWPFQRAKASIPVGDLSNPLFEEAFPSFRERLGQEKITMIVPLMERKMLLGFIALGDVKRRLPHDILEPLAAVSEHALESLYLYESSVTDETTTLYNKRFFRQTLQTEMRRADRYHQPCSLVAFDLDDFKQVNDHYGHPEGDRVLKEIGEQVRSSIREGIDIPARTGGEEFHVILPATDSARARIVAERIRTAVRDHIFTGVNDKRCVTISLGIATYPVHADEEARLVSLADQSLYLAKAKGKDKICIAGDLENEVFPPPVERVAEQANLIDPETLLYRPDYFSVRLKEELKRALRYQFPCALLIAQVEVPPGGSTFEAIRRFSPALRESLRIGIDTPSALDREHLGIIIPETRKDQAAVVASRLQSLAEGFTLSIGIVSFPKDALTDEILLKKAHQALEEARKHGTNQLLVWVEEVHAVT